MADYPSMDLFIDESDSLNQGRCLVIGGFFTAYPGAWRRIINDIRLRQHYWYEMHFHKISRNPYDKRILFGAKIADALLERETMWYARCVYVSPNMARFWQSRMRQQDLHAEFVEQLADRFFGHARAGHINVTVDAKLKTSFDVHFLGRLAYSLNLRNGRSYHVVAGDSKQDDLLQVADLIVGAVACHYSPIENNNKMLFANALSPLIQTNRIGVWHWP